MQTRLTILVVGFLCLLAGLLLGWWFGKNDDSSFYRSFRETSSGYTFISPLLFVAIGEEESFPRYRALKTALSHEADAALAAGKVTDVSIYFRNLNTSQWVGTHPDSRFSPSSMLKVITLIAVLAEEDKHPGFLEKRIRLSGDSVPLENEQRLYPPEDPVRSGNIYTVESLITHLIKESDNVANLALMKAVGDEAIQKVYDDLELLPAEQGVGTGYTAQEYSRLFRTLYNSTYLSRSMSEQALRMLSETSFDTGIVAGVPEGTVVSHKFGVRNVISETDNQNELHDCGIVYYESAPYFLCVMTRGHDLASLESVIKSASEVAWREVNALP